MSWARIKELRTQNAERHSKMCALVKTAAEEHGNKKRKTEALTEDENRQWDAMDAEFEETRGVIDKLERQEERQRQLDAVVTPAPADIGPTGGPPTEPTKEERAARLQIQTTAFIRWAKFGMHALTQEQRAAMHDLRAVAPTAEELRGLSPEEQRALSTTDGAGGFTIPEGFVNNIEAAMKDFSGMRQSNATILPTASGNDLPWPQADDTGNSGVLLAENTAAAEQDITFTAMTLNAFKYSSKMIKVSVELLQDTAFNLETWLAEKLGERIGRITNLHFTTGDGSSKPQGIVVASSVGPTTASATAVTQGELLELKHSVDPAYRRQSPQWMFNDSTLKTIKKLEDADGRLLWSAGLSGGNAATIDDDPYVINQDMASIASAAKAIIYGAMSKYIIRDVLGITLLVLRERFAEAGQVAFLAFSRHDGDLNDAGQKPVKHLLQLT